MTHKRVLLVFVVVAALVVAAGAGTAAGQSAPDCSAVSYNGDGSVQNPYEVGNVDQLQCINNQGLSENYTQVSDIDASGTSEWNNESSAVPGGFEPIGNLTEKFNGTFDGSGFTIENLYVNRMLSAFDGTGLFGRTGSGALLEDVGLENAYVNNPSNSSSRVGGLVGFNEGTVNSSYVTGTVSSSGDSVGGLVGLNDRASTILESYSTGDVSARDDSVGGLVGVNQGTVGESYATGNASGSNAVGGLVGNNDPGIVRDSYATGNVSAPSDTGGLVGKNDIGSVNDGYWDMNTTGQNTSEGSATGLDTPEMVGSPAVGNMTGFDFTDTWDVQTTGNESYPYLRNNTQTPPPVPDEDGGDDGNPGNPAPDCSQVSYNGDGSVQNPYEVGNVDQLQCISNQSLSANYTQVSDIDASGTSAWNNASGFEPIGDSSTAFSGTFNGSGFTINEVYVDRSRPGFDGTGLLGKAGPGAIIESVGLKDISVTNPSNGFVGGLVGQNDGTVRNSYATGNVSGSNNVGILVGFSDDGGAINSSYAVGNVSGSNAVGGLVGFNDGMVHDSNTAGNVSGSNNRIGGLAGDNFAGTVRESYATGNVSGDSQVGGLVGDNSETVESSYATGSVYGSGTVGGLVGQNDVGKVNSSYATGNVSSSGNKVGGLVGRNFDGTVSESHATGDVSGFGNFIGGLVGINENGGAVTSSYATGNVSGSGFSIGGLVGENENNGAVELSHATGDVSVFGNSPVGDKIGGLVGTNGETVRLSYATGNVSGNNEVGGLIGRNFAGTIRESYATGDVSGGSQVGGLVGGNEETVELSYSTGNVSGSSKVGGVVGGNAGTTDMSYATGSVSGSTAVGGIIGQNGQDAFPNFDGRNGTLRDSYWDTSATGQSEAIGKKGGDNTQAASGGESVVEGDVSGLLTTEMTGSVAESNITGFDFTGTWDVGTGSNESYPFLRNNTQTPPPIPEEDEGSFTEPLPVPGFDEPAQNIAVSEDGFSDTLYEDLDGDGNPTDIGPTVSVFGELIRGNDLGLTDAQAKKLNWNSGSPETEVTVADMVTLFGKQIRAE